MRWQKAARLAIAVFVIAFAGLVIYTIRQRTATPERVPEPIQRTEGVPVETPGPLKFERVDNGKLVYRLTGVGHKSYSDGRQVIGSVELTLPDRNGKTFVVTSDEGEFQRQPAQEVGSGTFRGNVRLTTNDGIEVRAATANYDDTTGVLTVPGRVEFTRGRMKGTGIGATYDRNKDVLWLLDQAHVTVAPDEKGEGATELTAGAAGIARSDNYTRLTRNGRIVSGTTTLVGNEITAITKPDANTIEQIQLRGNSQITEAGANPRTMTAQDIDLAYAPDGKTLQSARLMQNAVVNLPGQAGSGGRRIVGRTIDLTMGPDGSQLTSLNATENVQLDLPAAGDAPAKEIRAATLRASGPPDKGLETALFDGGVEYREARPAQGKAAAIDRTARSARLIVTTKPGLGDIEQADFRGNFRFADGSRLSAEAPRALYHFAADRIDLSPFEKEPGPTPFVNDGQFLVEARNIQMSPTSQKLTADTNVRSTVQPKAKQKSATNGSADQDTRMPVMLQQDRPVYVASNRLSYDGVSEATYSGKARLWQDNSQSKIDAETIVLNDRTGNLTARVNVVTTMLMNNADPKTKEKVATLMTVTANDMVYEDAKRLAVYTGTKDKQANMKGAQGDITGDRIDLYLAEAGGELDRAESHGNVTVREAVRTVKGQVLVYTSATDTYVMTGNPVEAIERETPTTCKKMLGTTLTFRRAVGSISADANGVNLVKSETIPCPAGSRD
jgi:lipopolysaccharide export system protein LptA